MTGPPLSPLVEQETNPLVFQQMVLYVRMAAKRVLLWVGELRKRINTENGLLQKKNLLYKIIIC